MYKLEVLLSNVVYSTLKHLDFCIEIIFVLFSYKNYVINYNARLNVQIHLLEKYKLLLTHRLDKKSDTPRLFLR